MASPLDKYFLPYQAAWIRDHSRFKIAEKSRRTGFTYAQSYEDVIDAARATRPLDVWFSSADESAALEYIRYCGQWAEIFNLAAQDLGEVVLSRDDDIKARSIEFANGRRINALSSNPKGFRSKGGKLILDEYSFHADPEAMWKAALPIITWGYPVRIISTYNGKGNRYYRVVTQAKKELREKGRSRWSVHTVTIEQAVEQGLAEKIVAGVLAAAIGKEDEARSLDIEQLRANAEREPDTANRVLVRLIDQVDKPTDLVSLVRRLMLTPDERRGWLEEQREAAGDEETWQQEYMCQPVDEATAWLTWDLIIGAEHPDAGRPELYQGGDCYVGMDIGRRRDLTVIWVLELVGDILWTREVVRLKGASFAEQDAEEDRIMDTYKVRRLCKDQTGMGEKPVEDSKRRHGEYRVEGVLFTGPVKQELATSGKQAFEDRKVRTPPDRDIRESHHAVRKLTTIAGNPRFDADRSEVGHADEFWAHMLAIHAAGDGHEPAAGESVGHSASAYEPQAARGRPHARMFR